MVATGSAAAPRTGLVVENSPAAPAGWLGVWLPEAGLALRTCRPYAGESLPADPSGWAALVVLGGAMGAYDDDLAPWLPRTRALLAAAVAAGIPTLGVCLGAQLLAAATGGAVAPGGAGPEVGLVPVRLTPAAARDPLFAGLPAVVEAVQWHWDTVTALPAGAVVLAEGATYPVQAFRLGACAWGVQFHLEATVPGVAHWAQTDAARLAAAGCDPLALVTRVHERAAGCAATWQAVAHRFARLTAGLAAARGVRPQP